MKRRDRLRRPARRSAQIESKRRLLVVCEGSKSEPNYLRGFQDHVKNPRVQVTYSDKSGDPKKVVEIAKKHKLEQEREAKNQRDENLKFDEVWCAFDRDEHPRFDDACCMAEGNGFELAISKPCFELWLLLHFQDNPGARDRHEMRRILKTHLSDYEKNLSFGVFKNGVNKASARAAKLAEEAAKMSEPLRNPTTGFYRLTDSIARE